MPCISPVRADIRIDSDGVLSLVNFRPRPFDSAPPGVGVMDVPCGHCRPCLSSDAADWAIRCMHEAKEHEDVCWITATYAPEFLPHYGILSKDDVRKFIRDLRYEVDPVQFRFFLCGEYGSLGNRPHYHAIIFGWKPTDLEVFANANGNKTYTSETVSRVWAKGHCLVSELTPAVARYTAGYGLKQIDGNQTKVLLPDGFIELPKTTDIKRGQRAFVHVGTGELVQYQSPFLLMSRKPGIGASWFSKFGTDVFPSDQIVLLGDDGATVLKPPRYYADLFARENPELLLEVKRKRAVKAFSHSSDSTLARLAQREQCAIARIKGGKAKVF